MHVIYLAVWMAAVGGGEVDGLTDRLISPAMRKNEGGFGRPCLLCGLFFRDHSLLDPPHGLRGM